MKRLLFLSFVFLTSTFTQAAILVIEGKYQNKNLYVQNGFASGGIGFCAKEVKVNGRITTDETNSSAFEIDLKSLALRFGDDVVVEIFYLGSCTPRVLNADDLLPRSTFETLAMSVSPSGLFTWRTENESGPLPYIVEQFKWNKWVKVGEVMGVGTDGQHDYSFQLNMHSGTNKFRLRQKGLHAIPRVSKEVTVHSSVSQPSFAMPTDMSSIDFSTDTSYEIYDEYGVIVRKGYGKQVDIQNLKKGNYYLCYDNTMMEFNNNIVSISEKKARR